MNCRVFFFFAVGSGTELRSAEADLGVPPKARWIRQEAEREVHELEEAHLDGPGLHRPQLLLTAPEKWAESASDETPEEETAEQDQPGEGPKEICKGHSILNDVVAQTGDDYNYAKAYGSILNAFKVSKRILELGDGRTLAHALQRWTSVFPQASVGGLVIGNVELPKPDAERTWTGRAGDHINLGLIPQEVEGPAANSDIVIDRTGRDMGNSKYQLSAWLSTYHLVIPGGMYIVEDVNAPNPVDEQMLPHEHPFCKLTFADPFLLSDEEVEQTGYSLSGEIGRGGFFLSTYSDAGAANMMVLAKHWPPQEVHFYPEEKLPMYYKVLNVILRGEPVHRILSLLSSSGIAPWKRAYPTATFDDKPEGCVDAVVASAKAGAHKHESWQGDFVRGVNFLRRGGYAIIQDLDFSFCGRSLPPGPDLLGAEVASMLEKNPDWFWAMPNDDEQQGTKLLVLRKQ